MTPMLERCAGLDVHKAMVTATVRMPGASGERVSQTESFATTTAGLLALRDWLQACGVTHVAMESTGVYWKPVYYVLEDGLSLLLVNAQHLRKVPGRKSDVRDSAWIAQLLECGLLRGSFVPPAPIRDLRELTRYRKQQMRDRTREVNRLHRVLEDTGLKVTAVLSDVMGASGRAILAALVKGTTDPHALAELAQGKLRAKLPALRTALMGRFRRPHAFLISQILTKIEAIEEVMAACSGQIDELLVPFAPALERLMTIPGVKRRTAEVIVAETGGDMAAFPSDAHLCRWAALCPGQEESAGRRRTGKTRTGNRFLRTALVESALSASRTTNTALRARYSRIKRSRGHKIAVVAVAHQILKIAYHVLASEVCYDELGVLYFDAQQQERARKRYVRQLEQLGYRVTLEQVPAA